MATKRRSSLGHIFIVEIYISGAEVAFVNRWSNSRRRFDAPLASRLSAAGARRAAPGPFAAAEGAEEIQREAGNQQNNGVANFPQEIRPRNQNVDESGDGAERRQRIKPHAERPRHFRMPRAQNQQP